jgi:hypothetical protein
VTTRYQPQGQWQGTPSDAHGWVSCGAYSNAVIVDAVSLGGCVPTGEQVRALTNEVEPNPADPGLTIPQLVAALARFGCRMEDRSGRRRASALADLRADRYLSASTWYSSLGRWRSQKGNTDFGHQVTIGRLDVAGTSVLLYDPLSRVKTGRWIPTAVIFTAMEDWGRRTGLPNMAMRYARSRRVPFLA